MTDDQRKDVDSDLILGKAAEATDLDQLDPGFSLERLVRMVTLVYELSLSGQSKKSLDHLAAIARTLVSMPDNCDLSDAIDHIVHASRAHVLLRSGQEGEAKMVASTLRPVPASAEPAALAARAWFLSQYGACVAMHAITCARQALALAPDDSRWLALLSETIRRERKLDWGREEVSEEEVSLLERAVAAAPDRSVRHVLSLARAHRERADSIFKRNRTRELFFQSQTFKDLSVMQERAFNLYKEALSLRPASETVNRLVGFGLLKLPGFKSDYRLAERCLRKALAIAPDNPTTLHCLGLYCYKGLMDYEMAAMLCEKAGKLGNFAASLDMLRMKRLLYGNRYDPSLDFATLLRQYGANRTARHDVLSQMTAYYMLFARDLSRAADHLRALINEQAPQFVLTSHKCTFLNMFYEINLVECFVNEASLYLQRDSGQKPDEGRKNEKELASFLDELKELYPPLFGKRLDESLVDNLHKASEEIRQTYVRKKERRDSKELARRRESLDRRRSSLDANLPLFRRSSEPNTSSYARRSSYGNIGEENCSRIEPNRSRKSSYGNVGETSQSELNKSRRGSQGYVRETNRKEPNRNRRRETSKSDLNNSRRGSLGNVRETNRSRNEPNKNSQRSQGYVRESKPDEPNENRRGSHGNVGEANQNRNESKSSQGNVMDTSHDEQHKNRRGSHDNVETSLNRNTNAPRKRVSFCGVHPIISESSSENSESSKYADFGKSEKKASTSGMSGGTGYSNQRESRGS